MKNRLTTLDFLQGQFSHGIAPETARLPVGWESKLVGISGENTRGAIGWCLDVHDLAFSKLAAGRRKDMEFVGISCDTN